MQIRFNSILNPAKIGFEFTGDSMTFWESAYRNGGVLNGAFGCYETFGDNGVQHSCLRACGVSEFTDFCVSLTKYMGEHLGEFAEFSTHDFGFRETTKETAIFLGGIVWKESKPQWFNLRECKVSSSESKRHDKRWELVPEWANGTIASAYGLYNLCNEHRRTYLFEVYALQSFFSDTLYGIVPEGCDKWDEITVWQKSIPGDHRQAFMALKAMVESIEKINYAMRAADAAINNSTARPAAEIAA